MPPDRLVEVDCWGVGTYFDGCSVEPELGATDGGVGWRVGASGGVGWRVVGCRGGGCC